MKAGIYVRVSTKEQTTLNQEIQIIEFCKRSNIGIFKTYKDEGVSGSKTSREGLDLMLQDMRKGLFDCVIVWKLDRLGRSVQHLLNLLEEFQNKNIRLICIEGNVDTDTPQGKFFFTIIGAFAELEREIIRERINLGLSRARAQGKILGRRKGSKDKKSRNKLGYWKRWAKK
jgi:DNA invertase Pin-like site-specific DNA recombinase